MAPNVQYSWEKKHQYHHHTGAVDIEIDGANKHFDVKYENDLDSESELHVKMTIIGQSLWKALLMKRWRKRTSPQCVLEDVCNEDQDQVETNKTNSKILDALQHILIMDVDPNRNDEDSQEEQASRDFLRQFNGQLTTVPTALLTALRERSPSQFPARVADFNENLFYDMQRTLGIKHLVVDGDINISIKRCSSEEEDSSDDDIEEKEHDSTASSSTSSLELSIEQFESVLSAEEYLGSFLTTESTIPQPPHVDYTWEILDEHFATNNEDDNNENSDADLMLGFFPLTEDGMFLQVWPRCPDRNDTSTVIEGRIVFIPYGNLLLLPANTIHAGGFRTTPLEDECGPYGNLRFHLYIARDGKKLPEHQTNKYTEPSDRGKELCERYVDSPYLSDLIDGFFV